MNFCSTRKQNINEKIDKRVAVFGTRNKYIWKLEESIFTPQLTPATEIIARNSKHLQELELEKILADKHKSVPLDTCKRPVTRRFVYCK